MEIYFPRIGDRIIGVVTNKGSCNYTVDINSPIPAKLSVLAFEGSTKRNRPTFDIGTVVYAKVSEVFPGFPPIITCVSEIKKDWVSGEAEFGEIKKGMIVRTSCKKTNTLLLNEQPKYKREGSRFIKLDEGVPDEKKQSVFEGLALKFDFEVIIGVNGYIWYDCNGIKNSLFMHKLIKSKLY